MIRRATPEDAEAVGRVFVAARDEMTYVPRIPDEDRPKLGGWIVERHEVWVAEAEGRIVGFIGRHPGLLEHIYVDPEGFQLWVFQKNEGARRFYDRHGFMLVRLTDGAENMERGRTRSTSGVL